MAVDPSTVTGHQIVAAHGSVAVQMQHTAGSARDSASASSAVHDCAEPCAAPTDRRAPVGYKAPGFATRSTSLRPARGNILASQVKGAASCAAHTSFEASCTACRRAHNEALKRQAQMQPQQMTPSRNDDRPAMRNYADREGTDRLPPRRGGYQGDPYTGRQNTKGYRYVRSKSRDRPRSPRRRLY